MSQSAVSAIHFVLGTLLDLYAMVVALRFVMQVVRADYYNPIAQFVVTATDPLLRPLRRVVPSAGRYDTASLLLCFLVLLAKLVLFKVLGLGVVPEFGLMLPIAAMGVPALIGAAVVNLVNLFFNLFIFSMIVMALMSWLPDAGRSPIAGLLRTITDPVLAPVRRFVPVMGGLDLSVLVAIVALSALRIFLVGTLASLLIR